MYKIEHTYVCIIRIAISKTSIFSKKNLQKYTSTKFSQIDVNTRTTTPVKLTGFTILF